MEFDLVPGNTTEGRGATEEKKAQMLADYPEKFEEFEPEEVEDVAPVIEEPVIEAPANMSEHVDVAGIINASQKPPKKGK